MLYVDENVRQSNSMYIHHILTEVACAVQMSINPEISVRQIV